MDSKSLICSQSKVVEKLNKTTKRIQKTRKNIKIAEKEAAEFEEIHKLLESSVDLEPAAFDVESLPKEIKPSDCSIIPLAPPYLKVFHDNLFFRLFNESNCCLKNFIDAEEKCLIFGKSESVPTEECFRKLIAYHVTENLMPEEGSCSSISLYVFYLMSVHQDLNFVTACSDFLKHQKFLLRSEDIFPVFINFGANQEDFGFQFCEENFLKKFQRGGNHEGISQNVNFPFFNVEMVGQILLQYITEDLVVINTSIKTLIQCLVKITLDTKIRSGLLLPLYSTILTILCFKLQNHFKLEEILSLVYLKEEHLLNQIEICRSVSRSIFPLLEENLVLRVLFDILKLEASPARPPIKISHIKSVLRKLRNRDLTALELYSVLQLINSLLPGVTATIKDSTEINALLASLEQKISKIVDSVDLIRLKLEIAKVGNLVIANNTNSRFVVHETMQQSSVKKVKCSN